MDDSIYEVVETADGAYMVLVNGYQTGGPIDRSLGCGTATYSTRAEARAELARLQAEAGRGGGEPARAHAHEPDPGVVKCRQSGDYWVVEYWPTDPAEPVEPLGSYDLPAMEAFDIARDRAVSRGVRAEFYRPEPTEGGE